MIRQEFNIESYWKVIVYYSIDYDLLKVIENDMRAFEVSDEDINNIFNELYAGEAKAVTCNNLEKHVSIVLFEIPDSREDFINSVVHEAEHIKQAMLEVYNVDDRGEAPAYTIGYIIERMFSVFKYLICKNNYE
jgi:hypothetical protein